MDRAETGGLQPHNYTIQKPVMLGVFYCLSGRFIARFVFEIKLPSFWGFVTGCIAGGTVTGWLCLTLKTRSKIS